MAVERVRPCLAPTRQPSPGIHRELPVKAVIFDIDGTLLHTSDIDGELYDAAVRAVLGPVQMRRSWGDYTHVTDVGILKEVLIDNGFRVSNSTIVDIRSAFLELLSAHIDRHGPIVEVRGARQFVQALQRCGTGIAYATGGWRASARMKLESAGFPVSGIPLATSDDSEVRVEIMRIALRRLGGNFSDITYYGDGDWDRAATRQLGWKFEAVGKTLGGITEYIAEAAPMGAEAKS